MIALSHERLCRLISFAAGTLLGVTLFSIIPETYSAMSLWQLVVALGSGYIVFLLVSHYVFHVCPACAASHFDEATTHRFSEIASAMVIALGLHSTMDGLALALGKESELGGGLMPRCSLPFAFTSAGRACALLAAFGFRPAAPRCIGLGCAVEATTLVGGAIGLWLPPQISSVWLDLILAHVGGGFIFLAFHAVFGELMKHSRALVLVNFASALFFDRPAQRNPQVL